MNSEDKRQAEALKSLLEFGEEGREKGETDSPEAVMDRLKRKFVKSCKKEK